MLAQISLIALALLITFFILRKRKQRSFVDGDDGIYQIKFDDNVIELIKPDGQRQKVLWKNLTSITLQTTDQGPTEPDVFWQFYTQSLAPELSFPQGTIGDTDLLDEIPKKLIGFDYQQVINAMGSTGNASFIIWSKEQSQNQ